MFRFTRTTTIVAGLLLGLTLVAADHAEARRGGSFGSRGARTYQAAPPTRTAPDTPAPVERSMAPRPAPGTTASQTQGVRSPGFMSGFGGSLFRGLLIGGLIGMLLGYGFGGLAGMLGFLLQAMLIVGAIVLLMRFFRPPSNREPALAGAGGRYPGNRLPDVMHRKDADLGSMAGSSRPAHAGPTMAHQQELALEQSDLDDFEQALARLQMAFAREDHAALRQIATPEMVSYLSEELAENAKSGLRNDVSDVRLLQADIAESWREGDHDYATAAMLYSSRDVKKDRQTGAIVEGVDEPTETTELWTFVRSGGADWKVSAIQDVSARTA